MGEGLAGQSNWPTGEEWVGFFSVGVGVGLILDWFRESLGGPADRLPLLKSRGAYW